MTQMIAILHHGQCNLNSIARAVEECGARACVTTDPADLGQADKAILPGVGAFPAAMDVLRRHGLDEALQEAVETRSMPVLGICLGMQLLAERGSEFEETEGLGLLPGTVRKLSPKNGERVPHVGWNEVQPCRTHPLLEGVRDDADFYFVHSYYLDCPEDVVVARTPYSGGFTSVAALDGVMASQFHPEKSQRVGFTLLRNFLNFAPC